MSDKPEGMGEFLGSPTAFGPGGWFLVLSTFLAAIIGGILGLDFFPPGRYPQIILLIPGAIAAGVYYVVAGVVVYGIEKMLWRVTIIRYLLWLPAFAGLAYIGYIVVMAFVDMFRRAF